MHLLRTTVKAFTINQRVVFTFQISLRGKAFRIYQIFLHHYFIYNRDNKMTLRIWWALITMLHIEQGQTSVTLRKRYKKTKTTHCRKGSQMLLYNVVKVKNENKTNVNCILGKVEGQTWTDTQSFTAGRGEMGIKKGKLITKPQIEHQGIPMPRISAETKRH